MANYFSQFNREFLFELPEGITGNYLKIADAKEKYGDDVIEVVAYGISTNHSPKAVSERNAWIATEEEFINVPMFQLPEVEKMMKRGDKLSVKFGTTKDLHPYAWIESKNVAGFKYLLNRSRLIFLVRYIEKGEVLEYTGDPMQSDTLKEGEDYQLYMLKQFIEGGQKLQYTPLFREYNDKISANKAMFKGTVFFRIPRTKENLDYLREKNQPI